MRIIHGGVAAGKTHRAIEWAKGHSDRGVLCAWSSNVSMYISAGLEPGQVLWFGGDRDRRLGHGRKNICIDDLDWILRRICDPHSPVMFTMTEWPDVEHLQLSDEQIERALKVMSREQFNKYILGDWPPIEERR